MSTSDVVVITSARNAMRLEVCMDTSEDSRVVVVYEDEVQRMTATMIQFLSFSHVRLDPNDVFREGIGAPPSLIPNTSTKMYTHCPTHIAYSMR